MTNDGSLVEIVSAVVPLRQQGREYHGPCPFCGEGHDRFIVWSEQGETERYWCRQCNRSGDGIQFLRDYFGQSFQDAAARFEKDISSPPPDSAAARHRNRLKDQEDLIWQQFLTWDRMMLTFVTGLHRKVDQAIQYKQDVYRHHMTSTEPIHPDEEAELEAEYADLAPLYDKQVIVAEWCDLFTYDARREERFGLYLRLRQENN